MTWAAVAVGGASLVGSFMSSNSQDKASQRAQQSASASNAINEKLAGISQEQWDLYKNEAVPMLKELANRRSTPDRTAEEVGLAAGDVKDQYAAARENTKRALGFARNPSDPGYADVLARSYGDEAGAVGRAMTEARRAERARVENTNWNRTLQAIQGYQRLPQDVSSNLNAASQGYNRSGALNADLANSYGRSAGQAGYAAAYLGTDAARRWYNKPPGNQDVSAMYSPSGDGSEYGTTVDAGYGPAPVGYPSAPEFYNAAEGGAITRRGVRPAVAPRALRRRTFDSQPYAMRFDDGGFVDQPSLDFIRNGRIRTAIDLTDQQKGALVGTPYADAPAYVQQEAVASRMLSGDQQFAPQTEQQRSFLNMLQQFKNTGDSGYVHRDWIYDPSWDKHVSEAAGQAPTMPGTNQLDSDWVRAEAERRYLGGNGPVTPNFRTPPAAMVQAANTTQSAPDSPIDPYAVGDTGSDDSTAAGDDGTSAGADAGAAEADGGRIGQKPGYGAIKGPGSGTSDSVKGRLRPGSYVLSADTVRSLGHSKIDKMFEQAGIRPSATGGHDPVGVAVRLSNGEVALPPEVVRHHGEEFFNKLQQKYHRPVHQDDFGMENGGAIRRRQLPRMVEDAITRSIPARAIGRRG